MLFDFATEFWGAPYFCKNLSDQALLGTNDLSNFKSVEITYDGSLPTLNVSSSASQIVNEFPDVFDQRTQMEITPIPIIAVSPDAAPIRTKPRPRTLADKQFIREEVRKLLNNGVIVESQSPWRSQVVADALSRISSLTSNTVEQDTKDMALKLHREMGHPDAHRLSKFLAPRVNSQENLQKIP